jgi:outer membrane receptor protein involved in Fe transport
MTSITFAIKVRPIDSRRRPRRLSGTHNNHRRHQMHSPHAAQRASARAFPRPQLIALAAAALCAAFGTAVQAQQAAKPADAAPEVRELEAVVVTGTARREGVRKLEAGFSITTATEEQIKQAAPASTADILKTVPGIFVETSGGQAGANIRVRGFPTPGDGR